MIDAYKIGVSIAMTNGVSQVLHVIQKDVLGLRKQVDLLQGGFDRMKVAAIGAGSVLAGGAILAGMAQLVESAGKLNAELERTKQLGGAFAATVDQARAAAFATSYVVPSTTPDENVRLQREVGAQLGNPAAAAAILPDVARVAAVVSHFTGEDQGHLIQNLTKLADLRAKIFSMDKSGNEYVDHAKLLAELNMAARSLELGGGMAKSGDLLTMARQAGVPLKTMTPEAFYGTMTEMGISQGFSRAGTSLTSLFSQFVGGTMPVHTAEEMQRMGLLNQGEWRSDHGHIVVNPNATHRLQEDLKDPIGFITGQLNDMMTKKGMGSQEKLLEVFRLFGRQTTERFVAEALSASPQFQRARQMLNGIPDVQSQYNELLNHDLGTNIEGFKNAWTGLMQALGSAGIPTAIDILHRLTNGTHELTQLVNEHPQAAAELEKIAAGTGAFLTVAGSAAVAGAAISALGVLAGPTGLLALAGGIAALAPVVERLGNAFTHLLPTWLQDIPDPRTGKTGFQTLHEQGGAEFNPLRDWFGWRSPPSGTIDHPNGIPHAGPTFGPQQIPGGSPAGVQRQAFRPPVAPQQPQILHVTLQADGRSLAELVTDIQARELARPNAGTTRFDQRVIPSYASDSVWA